MAVRAAEAQKTGSEQPGWLRPLLWREGPEHRQLPSPPPARRGLGGGRKLGHPRSSFAG